MPVVRGGAAAGLVAVLLPDGEELDEAERRLLIAIVAAAAPHWPPGASGPAT